MSDNHRETEYTCAFSAVPATLTIRNVPDEVYRALKSLAAIHKRSMEAEVRAIHEEHSLPKQRVLVGNELWELRRNAGVTKADAEADTRYKCHC